METLILCCGYCSRVFLAGSTDEACSVCGFWSCSVVENVSGGV